MRRLKGLSIEFNRLVSSENEISISEYLIDDGIPFCHLSTYRKMLTGEYTKDVLYDEMLKKKNIHFKYFREKHKELREIYLDIKKDIEFIDMIALSKHLKEAKEVMNGLEEIYPHKIECFILEQIERFYINEEVLDDKTIKILSWLAKDASTKSRAIIIHLIYFNMHKKRTITSSLKKTFESLPLFDKDEMLVALVVVRQMIYEKEYDVIIDRAHKLEKECLESENYSRLTEVYQDMIAIYDGLENRQKADYYVNKLEKLIHENDKVNQYSIERSESYLCMCKYILHQYEEAEVFLENAVLKEAYSFSTMLFYLSVVSFLDKESVIKVKDINLDNSNISNKVFLQYFIKKFSGRSKKELTTYILNKIMPILNVDYIFEANIFRQELYILGANEEFEILTEKMKTMNCVILQNWDEALENR